MDFTIWPAELEIETRARGRGRSIRATFPLGAHGYRQKRWAASVRNASQLAAAARLCPGKRGSLRRSRLNWRGL